MRDKYSKKLLEGAKSAEQALRIIDGLESKTEFKNVLLGTKSHSGSQKIDYFSIKLDSFKIVDQRGVERNIDVYASSAQTGSNPVLFQRLNQEFRKK